MERLKKLSIDYNIDLICLTEVNKDWRSVVQNNTIWNGTIGWRENRRIQVSNNVTKPSTGESLVGGTAMIAFDDIVFNISDQGQDHRKLGRWSFVTITGKNNLVTTFVTCYCPVLSHSPGSFYSQNLIYMAENHADMPENITCPRQLYGYDLKILLENKAALGHQLVVSGDFNSDYTSLTSWMQDLGLTDLIDSRHGKAPITYQRSRSDPIDRIFGSPTIKIKKGGFLSFGRLLSDHRGIYVDIPTEFLLGFNPSPITHPNARRLKMKDPRVVKKYQDILHQECVNEDLYNRMNYIHDNLTDPLPLNLQDEYENIDSILQSKMIMAERKCRRLKTGCNSWSPAYTHINLLLDYWRLRRAYKLGMHNNARKLIVLQNKLKITYDSSMSLTDINDKITTTYKKRTDIKKMADSLSMEYRTRLANAREEAGEGKAAQYIRSLCTIEQQRKLFQNIRIMEKKTKGGSTNKVVVTSPDGRVKEYTDKIAMEQVIAKSNEAKWHQTEGGSQFHSAGFIAKLGTYGEGPEVQKVLDGTFVPPHATSQATLDYLSACKQIDLSSIPTSPDIITRFKNTVQSWKVRRESTSTHGQHIAHFQASFKHKFLSWLMFQRGDIPAMSGYAPSRHKSCVDLMILKKSQSFELSTQRTLGILDSEYNNNNGQIGRSATHNSVQLETMAAEQFARPNRSALEEIIAKRCTIDHQQSQRNCYALTSCDLAGCYDRIVHTAAALALLRIGISHSRIKSMFGVIQKMVHRIRTVYGVSDVKYGGDDLDSWENWPQGVLQGNAAGPAIWTTVSSVIFDILHTRGFTSNMISSISKQLFTLIGFAYVDDCDLFQVGCDPLEVLTSMQSLINSWGSLMEVTGGVIRTDKSWWYLVEYVWKRGRWVATDALRDIDLVATGLDGKVVSLNRLRCDEAAEMLGIWLAPDGNKTKILSVLKSSALEWAGKVRMGNCSQKEAWTALHTNISAKLKYPLAACTFTEKECKSIMYPAVKAALPRSGITATLATDVRDGPVSSLGAGILSLYNYMCTARTACLVDQLHLKTSLGDIFVLNIEDLLLDSGLYGKLWDMNADHLQKYVSNHSWLFATICYNFRNNIKISSPHAEQGPSRVNDKSIMSCALTLFSSSSDLKAINRVRCQFGVLNVSDITQANGQKLDSRYLKKYSSVTIRNSFKWQKKHHVTPSDMCIWRRLLKWIFPTEHSILLSPLLAWSSGIDWLGSWDWFVSEDLEFLFHQHSPGCWHRHVKVAAHHHSYHLEFLAFEGDPGGEVLRASITERANGFSLLHSSSISSQITPPTDPDHMFDAISLLPPPINWFHNHMQATSSTSSLKDSLLAGTAIAVSDGSFFPLQKVGSCAWIISSPDGSEWISGGGLIPGESEDQNSYRSELGGQLGVISALISMDIDITSSDQTSVTTYCDGISALNTVLLPSSAIKARQKHADLISITASLWSLSPFKARIKHVRGHQDNLARALTVPEHLNCQMDALAKRIALCQISSSQPLPTILPTSLGIGTIFCEGRRISSNVQKSLYDNILHQKLLQYFSLKLQVPSFILHQKISWLVLARARRECRNSMKIFITKWFSNTAPTGLVLFRRKQRASSSCPLCDHPTEDFTHILQCQSPTATQCKHDLLQELLCWMIAVDTHPDIVQFIFDGLSSWLSLQPFSLDISLDPSISFIFRSQMTLGWESLLLGLIVSPIVVTQQKYYTDLGVRKLGTRWACNLIQKLWHIVHHIWLHRNSILHNTSSIDRLNGMHILDSAISQEYLTDFHTLPPVYHPYFQIPCSSLLSKSATYKKRWFLVIRTAREAQCGYLPIDAFSTTVSLRQWIGLLPLA